MNTLRLFASLKLTLVGMGILVVGAIFMYGNPTDMSIWVVVAPMMLLAVNLFAAILTNQRINENPGLLTFHVCLLGLLLLAAIGRMTHLDAQVEIMQGMAFNADAIMDTRKGPWHNQDNLAKVNFRQGPFTVQYEASLRRGLTHSYVRVKQGNRWQEKVVGDDRPLIIDGYRFYTTFNKGFSALVTWRPNQGEAISGVINMPSYPLFEYKQDNLWQPPGEKPLKFWLRLSTAMDENAAWVLDGRTSSGVLVVNTGEQRVELKPGESIELTSGKLRYDEMSVWMGYRVFYDPTLKWLFFAAVFGVLGLSHYFWAKINLQPWLNEEVPKEESSLGEPDDRDSVPTNESVPTNKSVPTNIDEIAAKNEQTSQSEFPVLAQTHKGGAK